MRRFRQSPIQMISDYQAIISLYSMNGNVDIRVVDHNQHSYILIKSLIHDLTTAGAIIGRINRVCVFNRKKAQDLIHELPIITFKGIGGSLLNPISIVCHMEYAYIDFIWIGLNKNTDSFLGCKSNEHWPFIEEAQEIILSVQEIPYEQSIKFINVLESVN